jgi:hypothetical protein
LRKFLLGAVVALTVASASPSWAVEIQTQDDPYEDFIEYTGPLLGYGTPGHGDSVHWFMAAHKKRTTSAQIIFLTVMISYTDSEWRAYDKVSMKGGTWLATEVYNRDVISCRSSGLCRFSEGLTAKVPVSTFLKLIRSNSPLSAKFSGELDDGLIEVSSEYLHAIAKACGLE